MEQLTSLLFKDPTKFFSGAASTESAVPYQVPYHSPDLLSNSASKLYKDILDSETSHDFVAFALQCYVKSLSTSPFDVILTISDAQYHGNEKIKAPPGIVYTEEAMPQLTEGPFRNIRKLITNSPNGIFTLFKSHFTIFTYNALYDLTQPIIEEGLNDLFDVFEDSHPVTLALSHFLVGGVLTPLDVIKTRVILQDGKKYHGIAGVPTLLSEETTLYSLHTVIPNVICSALGPVLSFASEYVIESEMHVSKEFSPVLYACLKLGFILVEVGIRTPFEVIKTRMNCVVREKGSFSTRVRMGKGIEGGVTGVLPGVVQEGGEQMEETAEKEWERVVEDPWWEEIQKKDRSVAESRKSAGGVARVYSGFWSRYVREVALYVLREM
ncbi:hypothetical protein HK098_001092 [Nowakowskiella sp. JEL0407]|nr:hypothetical protein HK098_001092 [Nowakowskiella sp. JEL0407]